jgi:hypothetical protein
MVSHTVAVASPHKPLEVQLFREKSRRGQGHTARCSSTDSRPLVRSGMRTYCSCCESISEMPFREGAPPSEWESMINFQYQLLLALLTDSLSQGVRLTVVRGEESSPMSVNERFADLEDVGLGSEAVWRTTEIRQTKPSWAAFRDSRLISDT